MQVVVHNGSGIIGGSCVEVSTDTTRIIFDLGVPLTDEEGNKLDTRGITKKAVAQLREKRFLPPIRGILSTEQPSVDAIFISHSHLDHYGFLYLVNDKIPVYMSQGCKDLISVAHYFGQTDYDPERAIPIPPWKTVTIGDIKVTPYLVDHSAFDAFAFLIEADGKKVFYSGDFRGHGRKSILFKRMIENPPKQVDVLIVEGTNVSQKRKQVEEEEALAGELTGLFSREKRLILISLSRPNIDRLISVYKACRRTGKTFVIDPYTAYILYKLQRGKLKIPQFNWRNVRVFFAKSKHSSKLAKDKLLYRFKSSKISYGEIAKKKENIVIMDSCFVRERFAQKGLLKEAVLVYSQWEGYLAGVKGFWEKHNVEVVKIHTSGHVSPEHLKAFVRAINPAKIIPVHTLYPEKFRDIFGDKVVTLKDEEAIEV